MEKPLVGDPLQAEEQQPGASWGWGIGPGSSSLPGRREMDGA